MNRKFNKLLEDRKVTAYRVAKETGINSTTIYNFKNGEYIPKHDKISKIADFLGVDVDYFYED